MNLSRPAKLLVGFATAWVALYPFVFFAVILAMIVGLGVTASAGDEVAGNFVLPLFSVMFLTQCVTIIAIFALQAFYVIHVIMNRVASDTVRIILGVGNFFMPFVAMPIYYYLFIWRDEPPVWALANLAEPQSPA